MMDSIGPAPLKLTAATSGFVLAAAITVLFSTALAWAKDAWAPLKLFMRSLTGQDWTTHGLVDVLLFVGLGFIFMKSRLAEKIDPAGLIRGFVAAVTVATFGLALWYAFF